MGRMPTAWVGEDCVALSAGEVHAWSLTNQFGSFPDARIGTALSGKAFEGSLGTPRAVLSSSRVSLPPWLWLARIVQVMPSPHLGPPITKVV